MCREIQPLYVILPEELWAATVSAPWQKSRSCVSILGEGTDWKEPVHKYTVKEEQAKQTTHRKATKSVNGSPN